MKKNKKELLGLRLKEYRENRKLTQDKLAEMVGIDPKHLSRIENGRNYPSLETLEKILDSLDVSYEEIFNFKLLVSKDELIKKINSRLEVLEESKLKLIYNIVNEI
ncbi:MAG: helix-turn-helix domain-containing protein [Candidatus Gastranaerophilales bacterium]|nr:helix-turn-helix domain-containing protein [Candidatus Gastranaerophilales bacterium]